MITVGIVSNGYDIGFQVRWVHEHITPAVVDAVRSHAKELENAARDRALNLHMGKGGDHSLRRSLAAAIFTRMSKESVSFVLSGDRMPKGKQQMPFATVSRSFRHPVFGHKTYVTQAGDPGWFAKSIIERAVRVLPRDISRALNGLVEHTK